MQEKQGESSSSSSTGPHRMRITSGGDVAGYVNFALTFLKENPTRSLVLHTLPPESSKSTAARGPLNPTLLATPKLVSVVEKIKREYMAYINTSDKGKGKNKAVGIWQYNESGVLPGSDQEELGLDSILEGRKKPKMVHRPYLQITLSTRPLGLEEGSKGRNVTCQYIMVRRRKSESDSKVEKHISNRPGPNVSDTGKTRSEGTGGTDKVVKRKADGSQVDSVRGGKKRKKQG